MFLAVHVCLDEIGYRSVHLLDGSHVGHARDLRCRLPTGSVAGGRWPVAGGRWLVAGGWWRVTSGRLAGGWVANRGRRRPRRLAAGQLESPPRRQWQRLARRPAEQDSVLDRRARGGSRHPAERLVRIPVRRNQQPSDRGYRDCKTAQMRALTIPSEDGGLQRWGATARLPLNRHYVIGRRAVKGFHTTPIRHPRRV